MRLLVTIFIVVLGAATAHAETYQRDLSLIRVWDQDFYCNHPYQPFPKVVRYEGQRTLTFVATKHKDWKSSQEIVIYGAGHFAQQEAVLTKMLGSPQLVP